MCCTADDIISVKTRDGNEGDILGLKARGSKEGGNLLRDLQKAVLRPRNCVKLVDSDDQALHAHAPYQQSVFLGLSAKAGFKSVGTRVDDKNRKVRLACSSQHVRNKISMTWCIKNGERSFLGFKLVAGNVDSDPATPFL